ncbi:MAG: ribonuclease III [Myxococcales bacterium]|nr:ribonuclease III [Myxococcales bacterium]
MDSAEYDKAMARLEVRLGYSFDNRALLRRAFTHRSYANEFDVGVDNQRLEYLGDAVLDLVVSTELFKRYPELSEGRLSYLRSQLVCEASLAEQSRRLDLGACMLLGKGEFLSGGSDKDSVLADAYEAMLASVYLDGGFQCAYEVIVNQFDELLDAVSDGSLVSDYKTRLQELIQADKDERPHYHIASIDGPPHARVYTALVSAGEHTLGEGTGCSKKAAQQDAARVALEQLLAEREASDEGAATALTAAKR